MAKYSFKLKKKVVNLYLNGEGSFEFIAKKYEIPACTNVKTWVRNYKNFGDERLFRSRKYKLHVVELYLSSEISYQEKLMQTAHTEGLITQIEGHLIWQSVLKTNIRFYFKSDESIQAQKHIMSWFSVCYKFQIVSVYLCYVIHHCEVAGFSNFLFILES